MKKILALVLAAVMCLSLFAGCGNGSTESNETNPPAAAGNQVDNTPVDTTPAEPLLNKDIYPLDSNETFVVATTNGQAEYNGTSVADFMEKVTGVTIDYVSWNDEQRQLSLGSKELPDAFFMQWGVDKTTCYEYGDAGYLVNFADYLDIMPNFSAVLELHPEVLDVCQNEDGSIYCLPAVRRAAGAQSNVIYARMDMLKAAGWDELPTTTEEFLQCIIDLQAYYGADDPEFVAFSGYQSTYMDWNSVRTISYFFPAFGDLADHRLTVDANGKVVLGSATEQWKYTMQYLNKVYTSGAFSKDVYTLDSAVTKALAAGDHIAISMSSAGFTADQFENGSMADNLTLMPAFTSEYCDEAKWLENPLCSWSSFNAISTSCKDIETMVRWFDALYSTRENPLNDEGTAWGAMTWWGEYGVDWVVDEEARTVTELPDKGYSIVGFANSLYYGMNDEGTWAYVADPNTGYGVKCIGNIEKLWPVTVTPYNLALLTLTEDETDTYNDAWADISTYMTQMTAKFITGEVDVEAEWDNYIATLDQLGLQDVYDVYQAAYDRANN